ncbi:hypothetical protein Peur_071804 [Populus x canadensis]|jgi:hypothetical protein
MIQTYETQKYRPFWLLRKCRSDQETLDSKETTKRTALTLESRNSSIPRSPLTTIRSKIQENPIKKT